MAGAAELIHHDSVVHGQARLLRQLHSRRDAQAGHQDLGHELAAGGGTHETRPGAPVEPRHPLAEPHRHALLPVIVHEEARQVSGIHPRAEPRLRDEHGDVAPLHSERRRDLAPDEAAAQHAEAHALGRERPQPAVVVERAEIDDLIRLERQLPWGPAGGEQQLGEPVARSAVVRHLVRSQIDRADAATDVQLRAGGGRLAPDLLLGLALPKRFRERRPVVRGVRLRADHADRSGGIGFTDGLGGGGGGHAAAHDHIRIVGHRGTVIVGA